MTISACHLCKIYIYCLKCTLRAINLGFGYSLFVVHHINVTPKCHKSLTVDDYRYSDVTWASWRTVTRLWFQQVVYADNRDTTKLRICDPFRREPNAFPCHDVMTFWNLLSIRVRFLVDNLKLLENVITNDLLFKFVLSDTNRYHLCYLCFMTSTDMNVSKIQSYRKICIFVWRADYNESITTGRVQTEYW